MFCAFVSFLFAGAAVLSAFAFLLGSEHKSEDVMVLAVIMVLTLPPAAIYGAGVFIPRRPWGWIAGIILIAGAMVAVCALPVAIGTC